METAFQENVIAFPKQDYERWQEIAKKVRDLIKQHKHGGKSQEDPLTALKLRYAKGEISKKEFEEMKKVLK